MSWSFSVGPVAVADFDAAIDEKQAHAFDGMVSDAKMKWQSK